MPSATKSIVWAQPSTLLARAGWILFFAALTGAGAWIRIPLPFTPVPITLQTGIVLAAGVVLGRDGVYAQIVYLLLGGIGFPMFASGTYFPAFMGPTGGYLIGFILAAAGAARWVRPTFSSLSVPSRAWRLLLVSLLVFIPGVLHLKLFTGVSISAALALGFYPFVLGDVLKVALVSAMPSKFLRR